MKKRKHTYFLKDLIGVQFHIIGKRGELSDPFTIVKWPVRYHHGEGWLEADDGYCYHIADLVWSE